MLFSSSKYDVLLKSVAQQVRARFPPVVANDPERTVSQERIREIVDEILSATLPSERQHPIGFFGRAGLKSALRGELREIGYDEKFVDFAVERFTTRLRHEQR